MPDQNEPAEHSGDEAGHQDGDICLTYADHSIYIEITKRAADRYELAARAAPQTG